MLENLIRKTKALRGFNPDEYVRTKVFLLNKFFKDESLDSVVIGISGGIDSAVTLSLLMEAAKVKDSPIKEIVGVIAPIHSRGVTGQIEATKDAENVCLRLMEKYRYVNFSFYIRDLTDAYEAIIKQSHNSSDWSRGQLASVLRTPLFYYYASIIQDNGGRSIVVGTINKDEGSYLGFFGKASDAMVDLQPIADVHKSEVYEVANYLGVPREIIERKPKGDVWDGKVDEEMIGAPYWFVEAYLIQKQHDVVSTMTTEEEKLYQTYAESIEKIHYRNEHKYRVGMPSHFIDVMPRTGIPGGW